MDVETSEAIGEVRADLRHVEASLSIQIEARVGQSGVSRRAEMREFREEIKHHFDVVAEGLRDDIRVLAGGFVSLDAKVTSLGTKVTSLDVKVASLDTKVTSLDRKATLIDAKVTSLDTKVTTLDVKVTGVDDKVAAVDAKVESIRRLPGI